jgi:hypothetical protein
MKRRFALFVMGLVFFLSGTLHGRALPPLQVVTGADPKGGEPLAAQELALYLGKITGTTVPVISEAEAKTNTAPARRLYVGQTDYAKAAGLDGATMGAEEWAFKTIQSNLILTGGRPRGTLFGVYEFLENYCGVHWFDRDTEVVPSNSNFKLPAVDVRDKNALRFHSVSKKEVAPSLKKVDDMSEEELVKQERFLRRNRCGIFLHGFLIENLRRMEEKKYPLNGTACLRDGGGRVLGGHHLAHTFYVYISPEEFEVSHPEYFGFSRVNQKFKQDEGCLCLSLPEVRALMIERVKQRIAEDRKFADRLGFEYPEIYSISQMDNSPCCPCPECRRFVKEHGQESDLVLDFVNHVASAVGKEYPEILFTTLAYQWSLAAPQVIKPNSNVAVVWCNWGWGRDKGGDGTASYDQALTHPDNQMRLDVLKSWQKVGGKFFFWDYHYLGSAAVPLVETPYAVSNIKLLNELGLLGVYIESEENDMPQFPRAFYGPWHKENFFPLRYWITYQLLSNPEGDVDALTDTFFKGYFGPAAGKMREFYDFLIRCQEKPRRKHQLLHRSYTMDYLTSEFFVTADRLCQQAESQCTSKAELLRVRQERIRVDLGILELWGDLKRQLPEGKELPFNRDQVITRLESAGREVIAGRPWHSQSRSLTELTNLVSYYRQPKLPEPFGNLDAAEYIDITWRFFPGLTVRFPRSEEDLLHDPEAAMGGAIFYKGKEGWDQKTLVFTLDNLRFSLDPAEFPADGKYHAYKIGRTSIQNDTYKIGRLFANPTRSGLNISNMTGKMGMEPLNLSIRLDPRECVSEWDVYVSVKMVKSGANPKAKGAGGLWLDRVLLVRAVPGNQRPDAESAALKTLLDQQKKEEQYISEYLKTKSY